MSLTPSSDVSAADWLLAGTQPWGRLVTLGPAGFAAYARLLFLPDPTSEGQDETDAPGPKGAARESALLDLALEVLARHTSTPDACWYAVWEGWPDLPPALLGRPRVAVPYRPCYLLHGTLSDCTSAHRLPGRRPLPDPALLWPADRAWCLTDDVDPHWAGIGGSAAAVEELLADPRLDVVRADPGEVPPRYR